MLTPFNGVPPDREDAVASPERTHALPKRPQKTYSERLHLHRAFISWLGSNVFRRTEISKDILHCNAIFIESGIKRISGIKFA